MKKLVKNIIYPFIGLAALACTNEWEAPTEQPSHHLVFSSEMDFDNKIQVNGNITFGDVSTGVTSRTWTLDEGLSIIDTDGEVTSESDIIKVLGNKAGVYEVKLSQTFSEKVFVGDQQSETTSYDTAIVVTVLDSVALSLKAQYVNADGSLGEFLNLKDDAKNEVIAGSVVRYSYEALGEPSELNYSFGGGNPSVVAYGVKEILEGLAYETDVKYTQMGIHSMSLIGGRKRPFDADTLMYQNVVEVVASTEPVTLDAVQEFEDQVALVFSREIDPLTLSTADFMVKIMNGDISLTPAVSLAKTKDGEGNVVLLSLADEKIYTSDQVTVTYTPGMMKTTDGMAAEAFEENIEFEFDNILDPDVAGFENNGAGWGFWTNSSGCGATDAYARTGTYSMNLNSDAASLDHPQLIHAMPENAKAGVVHRVSFWVYVVEASPNNSLGFADLRLMIPGSDWASAAITDPSNETMYPKNTWVQFVGTVVAEDTKNIWMRSIGGNELYIDDLEIAEYELRP